MERVPFGYTTSNSKLQEKLGVKKVDLEKYLPVVVDIETGGFDPNLNAILEIAITLIEEKDKSFYLAKHTDII